MRRIASGTLLASLFFSVCAVPAAPATAGEYWQGRSSSRYVTYQSSCCYRKVVKRIVAYQRIRRPGYSHYRRYQPSHRRSYYGHGGGYATNGYRYRSYDRSYRPRHSYHSGSSYRQPYRSYRTRYSYDGGYDRRPYRSYSTDRSRYGGGYYRQPYRGYGTRYSYDRRNNW